MCGWGELEDSIDWTSIFKLQLVFLCPYLKKGSCDILFVFVIRRKVYFAFFYHSLYASWANSALIYMCKAVYKSLTLFFFVFLVFGFFFNVSEGAFEIFWLFFFSFFSCVLKWSFSLMASTVGFFPCLTLSLEAGIKWCLCTGVLAVGVGDLCLKSYLKQIFSGLLGTPVGSN